MPIALFKYVREVSSEDDLHCAKNLLQGPMKKWKTRKVGEKSAYVILEMEKPEQITGIDVGNEHSAFVEILVGNTAIREEDFTELLLSCSFMTPTESKNSTSINRVRCFNSSALVQSAVPKKWKMVKVICTQPYNRHVQYGLSFIKVHIAADGSEAKEQVFQNLVPEICLETNVEKFSIANKAQLKNNIKFKFGKFALRPESPDSESESTTTLFSRWRTDRNSGKDSSVPSPRVIKQASPNVNISRRNEFLMRSLVDRPHSKPHDSTTPCKDRNREELIFGEDERSDSKNERLEKAISKDRERLEQDKPRFYGSVKSPGNSSILKTKNTGDQVIEDSRPRKRQSSGTKPLYNAKKPCVERANIKYCSFNKLLNGVVLVISGIQNPERSILRSKALELGATYKSDWQSGCTHLICAFKNTPKYNQVKGKGKIVKGNWIESCHQERKYIPWRRFALDADLRTDESDEEVLDESLKSASTETKEQNCPLISKIYDCSDNESGADEYGQDTDDEIEQVNRGNTVKATIYDEDTVEEDYLKFKLKMDR